MEELMNRETVANCCGIVIKSSYKQRDGRQVVHYKCDRRGVDRNCHGLVEYTRARKAKVSALIDCPSKGVGREAKGKATHQD